MNKQWKSISKSINQSYKHMEARMFASLTTFTIKHGPVINNRVAITELSGPSKTMLPNTFLRNGKYLYCPTKDTMCFIKNNQLIKKMKVGQTYSYLYIKSMIKFANHCSGRLKCILTCKRSGIRIKVQENITGFKVLDIKALKWDKLPKEYKAGKGPCVYLGSDGNLWYKRDASKAVLIVKHATYCHAHFMRIKQICRDCGKRLHDINKNKVFMMFYGESTYVPKEFSWEYKHVTLRIRKDGPNQYVVTNAILKPHSPFNIQRITILRHKNGSVICAFDVQRTSKELGIIKKNIRSVYARSIKSWSI